MTSRISEKQQMNVPIRTKNNEEVQTDVNLIGFKGDQQLTPYTGNPDFHFLEFVNQSWMMPFSDYYLLNQLNSVIQQLRNGLGTGEEFKTRKIVDELAAKIHGLLARELKVTGKNTGYYDMLLEKQKQLTKLEIKYGNFEKKIDSYLRKIQELEREIKNLRGTLKIYQGATQQNQLYKGFFKEFKQFTTASKKITDYEKLLNQQILPKIREFEINLAEVSKNASKNRSSKQKALISRYALELDDLSKSKQLDWTTLSSSAASFFTGIEHLNNDDWVQQRLNVSEAYNELRTRHVALISLVNKNVQQLLKKDASFKSLAEVSQLIRTLEKENREGYETMLVNGWIGLGVIHCHQAHGNIEQVQKLNGLILLFQTEFRKLLDKYPQLNETLSAELRQFLAIEVAKQVAGGDALTWIKQILVKETEVIHVDNVYNYYSKTDKQNLYYLRVLVKALLDQLRRINNDHKIAIELDQEILQLLRNQVLDNVNVDDVIALFRPTARVCEMPVIVQKPNYIVNTQTVGVPLRQQNAVVVSDKTHFAVNLQQGVPYRKEIPYEYSKTEVVQVPMIVEKPYSVPTKVVQEVIKYDQKINVVKVPIDQEKFIQVIQQNVVEVREQYLATQTVEKEVRVPYKVSEVQIREIQVEKQVSKNAYRELNKIFKVEQTVPKVYKEPKFEIVEKPVHHVIVQKEIEFVEVQKPIIERLEVAKVAEVLVQKPIYYPEHCDCQKPEAVVVEIEKPIYKQIPKEIIVQKCHFVQPNVEQKIVQIACHTQVPVYKQVIRQEPVFIEKIVPFKTIEEKLVVVDRQIPFFIEHFTPVELVVERPVIVRDIKHVPVQVEQPVPIYIEKIIPKVVQVFRDKIIEKIVQVPRVEIVQRIVQKIVTIPRIVQRIVTVPQLVQVPIFIQTPVLEVVEIPVERLVTDIQEREKIVQVKSEVLKIEKTLEVVDKIEYEQVKKIIQIQPEVFPEVIVQKIVKVIEEHPIQIYIDRLVDRVIQIKEIVPVEKRVQIPIQVQMPVEVITNKPIFYKQPVVQIDVQRVEREKLVQVEKETIQIHEVPTPYIQKQKQIVHLPGQTIILKEPELHIIEVQKQNIITTRDIEERPIEHYLDIQKAHVVDQQTYVVPEKEVLYLDKPYAVAIEKPVKMRHQEMVVVERPETVVVKTRQGINEQVIKVITQEKLVAEKESYPQPITVPEHHYHVVYEQLPPKAFEKSVMVTDEKVRTQEITSTVEVEGTSQKIVTKEIQVPVYMQKIFEKILMLPQIVEVEKKVYLVEEINNLIAKEVSLETHYDEYRGVVKTIQDEINALIVLINSGSRVDTAQLKKKLQVLLELFRTESRMPKIVQNIREVEVIRERDRPVLVPVYDSEREKVLHLIISDLVEGVKGLSKIQLEKRFSERVRNLFSAEFGLEGVSAEGIIKQYVQQSDKTEVQSRWKSWLENYDKQLPSTRPAQELTEAEQMFIVGYDTKDMDYATLKASLQKLTLVHKQRLYEIERLKGDYSRSIDDLRLRIDTLETLVATQKYYKDLYLSELLRLKQILEKGEYQQVKSTLQTITTIKQEFFSSRIKPTISQVAKTETQFVIQSGQEQKKISDFISQLTKFEEEGHTMRREIQTLNQENQRLRREIDETQLNIPVWSRESSDEQFKKYNEQWEDKIKNLEQNHFIELTYLREQLMKRLTDGSTEGSDQFSRVYDELTKKYTELIEAQRNSENERRNLISSYEDKLRDLNKQLITIRRENEAAEKKNEADRKRIIDEYEKKLTSSSSNQEKELRKQLDQVRRNYENAERVAQAEKKKLINEYEAKLKSATSTQGNQERQLKRQLDNLKRSNQQAQRNFENEKKRLIDEYETKLKTSGSAQERELRKELDIVKRNLETFQKNADFEKKKLVDDYEERLKGLKDDFDRAKASRKSAIGTSPEQLEELQILRERIKKLEIQLNSSKKQVESYQKSRLGQTTYTSGLKQSDFEGAEFQSPHSRYKKSQQASEGKEGQQLYEGRSSEGEAKRIVRSGVRGQKIQQAQQVRSQSSKVSGVSQSSMKSSMKLRELIDMKNIEDRDQITTAVMFKILEQIEKQAAKGIINSYTPSNIHLNNFNPNNLSTLIIKFGAPITNRKNKTDGLYLAPQILRGEPTSLKSVVFTLAIIWDELIHSENYFKTVGDIENLTVEFKVRDTNLNPILRNTLFEMMSKDPAKRLELSEAKRRISLQRFIVGEGRGGTTTSRVSSQSRRS